MIRVPVRPGMIRCVCERPGFDTYASARPEGAVNEKDRG